jgi:hypothetical protein
MKIYIVTSHEVLNCEDQDVIVNVFTTRSEAKKCFEEKVYDATDTAVFNDWWIDETTETTFKAFEEGYECQNNIKITLIEQEL